MGLRRGAAWGCAGAQQRGAAQGRSVVPRRGAAAWGGAGAQQCGAAQGHNAGPGRGAAAWGCAGAQRGAAHGRGMGSWRGAAAWRCAEQLCGVGRRSGLCRGGGMGVRWSAACSSVALRRAAVWAGAVVGGCVGAQRHGGALGRSVWLYRGCAGLQQRGAAQGRSSVGPRRGAAARGCAEQLCGAAQWCGGFVGGQRGAAHGRSVGLRRGAAAWGCARAPQRGAA